MKRNVTILLIVCLLVGFAVYQNMAGANKKASLPQETAPKLNFLAPEFALSGFDGQQTRLDIPRSKAVIVNFWASWCGPCKEEAPELVKLYNKYRDKLDLYAVNITNFDSVEDAKTFALDNKLNFPILLDEKGKVSELYRASVWPTSFLIDKDGVIRDVIYGVLSPKEMERRVKAIL